MKKFIETWWIGLGWGAFLLFAFALTIRGVTAQGLLPEGIESFTDVFGRACTTTELGGIDCDFDPCLDCGGPDVCKTVPTPTPSTKKTPTPKTPTRTSTPKPPTKTPTPAPVCKIWLCHKPGTAAEQDYCCEDSTGCRDAHLAHGDYLGKCK